MELLMIAVRTSPDTLDELWYLRSPGEAGFRFFLVSCTSGEVDDLYTVPGTSQEVLSDEEGVWQHMATYGSQAAVRYGAWKAVPQPQRALLRRAQRIARWRSWASPLTRWGFGAEARKILTIGYILVGYIIALLCAIKTLSMTCVWTMLGLTALLILRSVFVRRYLRGSQQLRYRRAPWA